MIASYRCRYCKRLVTIANKDISREDAETIILAETYGGTLTSPPADVPKMIEHNTDDHIGIADFVGFFEMQEEQEPREIKAYRLDEPDPNFMHETEG